MNIHTLSDLEVESRLKYLARKERELLHLVLAHIKEIEIRKLFLQRGYSTMYDYLTKELHYSGSAAMRRLEASRILRDVPGVARKIHEGTLNLSQLSELSRAVKEKRKEGFEITLQQKTEIVERISGMTTLETQKQIAQSLEIKLKKPEHVRMQRDDSVHISLTLSRNQHHTVMQAKDRAAHLLESRGKDHSLASFFEILSRGYLHGRIKIQFKEENRTDILSSEKETPNEVPRKSVTPKIRALVLARDQCCQYVDPETGKRCESTYGLEVDHRHPQWAGGDHSYKNLQVLCTAHNKFKYQKESGVRPS